MVVAIIAGSRSIKDYSIVDRAMYNSMWDRSITEVISGGAVGVDTLAVDWAMTNKVPEDKIHVISPDYAHYPPLLAPLVRNEEMAKKAKEMDRRAVLIAVWHPDDRDIKKGGTAHMILMAHKYGLRVYVEVV